MVRSSTVLLRSLADGQEGEAWGELIERHGAGMRSAAEAAAGPELADDALQEAALQIRAHAGQFRPRDGDDGERAASGWMRTVAAHCALMLSRTARRRKHHEGRPGAPGPPSATPPPELVIASEERQLLRAALAELPERHR